MSWTDRDLARIVNGEPADSRGLALDLTIARQLLRVALDSLDSASPVAREIRMELARATNARLPRLAGGGQLQAECMAGQYVLESFAFHATKPWMVRYRPTFAGMMLDSGAFSEMQTGAKIDLGEYIDYAKAHEKAYDAIVNLDVIRGEGDDPVADRVRRSQANLQAMRDAGLRPMPVFHQGEPWSVLTELAQGGVVGLGCQRPMKEIDHFLDGCFSRLPSSCKVHGFALANEKYTGRYPFDSVDSATWLYELKALSALKGQGSDVLRYLTQGELLRLVVTKYERLPRASAWAGTEKIPLFSSEEET